MEDIIPLKSPSSLKLKIKISEKATNKALNSRKEVEKILDNNDKRIIIIVGPCSIHNFDEAIDYAEKLKVLSEKVKPKILIVMRVYLEKPRTNIGWKGFINDPNLSGKPDILSGIIKSRELLIKINEIGVPCATEFLEPLVVPYIEDLISWGAIGARTTESQVHRMFVSGLNIPIGFKNLTNGDVLSAINAILTSKTSHSFIGVNENGIVSIISTSGNKYGHIVLRGGETGPNYHEKDIKTVGKILKNNSLRESIIVDCSHGNSNKDYKSQSVVFKEVINQIKNNNNSIKGLMLESNINEGNQKISMDLKELKIGVSITDSCIGWDETEKLIMDAYNELK
jgi:3-deoxy-7-phosphoheptulonate synthase